MGKSILNDIGLRLFYEVPLVLHATFRLSRNIQEEIIIDVYKAIKRAYLIYLLIMSISQFPKLGLFTI